MPLRLLFTRVERIPQPEKTKILGRVVVLLLILVGLIGTLDKTVGYCGDFILASRYPGTLLLFKWNCNCRFLPYNSTL